MCCIIHKLSMNTRFCFFTNPRLSTWNLKVTLKLLDLSRQLTIWSVFLTAILTLFKCAHLQAILLIHQANSQILSITHLLYSNRICSNRFFWLVINFCNAKTNKTARIRAKFWTFRLPFKVYGAVITWKKLNVKKKRS